MTKMVQEKYPTQYNQYQITKWLSGQKTYTDNILPENEVGLSHIW